MSKLPSNFTFASLLGVWLLPSQSLVAPSAFEVASVRPSAPSGHFSMGKFPGGRFVADRAVTRILIEMAYHVNFEQLKGAPPWVYTDKFDINASAGRSLGSDELPLLLQTLLQERFKLQAHWEQRPSTVYVLAVSPKGPKLESASAEPTARFGIRWVEVSRNVSAMSADKANMRQLADKLAQFLTLPVTDETGLEGNYKLALEFAREGTIPPAEVDTTERSAPTIFTALQERLGLKLITRKGTAKFLVIDHIERPSEN
jgi:uncharacterized protein (TIGR03435 family)